MKTASSTLNCRLTQRVRNKPLSEIKDRTPCPRSPSSPPIPAPGPGFQTRQPDDVSDYHFLVRPLIDEHEPAIWYAVDGKVAKLPAERVDLDWTNEQTKYSEPSQHLVVDEDGSIFVCCPDGDILCTRDGGRTWDPSYEVGSGFASVPGTPGQILAEMSENTVGGEKYDREWPERARQTMW